MNTNSRDSMRAAVLEAVDEYGEVPGLFSSFRYLIADAVLAAHDHEERRKPDHQTAVSASISAMMGTYRTGHDVGYRKAHSQAVDALRAAGMHDAAEVVQAL